MSTPVDAAAPVTRDTITALEYLGAALPEWGRDELMRIAQTLLRQHDRLMSLAGADVYERMMQAAAVSSPVQTLQLAICAAGWQVRPSVPMPSSAVRTPDAAVMQRARRAAEVAEFVERCLDGMSLPLGQTLEELTDALVYGHRVAEVVYRMGTGVDAGRFVLDRLAVKPAAAYFLIVSRTGELLGLRANDRTSAVPDQQVTAPVMADLPRWKFLHVAHRPRGGDPRGTSLLMPAYHAWFGITQVRQDHFKFLRGFGNPFIVGKVAQNNAMVPDVDEVTGRIKDGAPPISGTRQMLNALQQLAANNLIAIPDGASVEMVQGSGTGEAFDRAFDAWKRDIHEVVLGTAQATTEAKAESRSSKDGSHDVVQLRVIAHRITICEAITRDVLRVLVAANYGEAVAAEFTPRLTMASSESRDLAKMLPAFAAALRDGVITREQLPWVWEYLGIDGPDGESWRARLLADAEDRALAETEAARILEVAAGAA